MDIAGCMGLSRAGFPSLAHHEHLYLWVLCLHGDRGGEGAGLYIEDAYLAASLASAGQFQYRI